MYSLTTLFKEFTSRIEALRSGNEMPDAISSGFENMDRALKGFQRGKLYVIGGRPSMGTTTFMVTLVHNMLLKQVPPKKVAVFLMDLSARPFIERLVSCTTEIWLEKITRGLLTDSEWEKMQQQGIAPLLASPLSIDDEAALSVTDIAAKCDEVINRNGLDIVFIDNLQLIKTRKGLYPDEEIAKVMTGLRDLARTRNIPIVVLSQMSPAPENKRGRKRKPQLSELEESGAIGQEADVAMFLYRHEYFDIIENEAGENIRGETHIRIARNRLGSFDTIRLKAQLHIQKFEEYENVPAFYGKIPGKKIRHSDKTGKQNGTLFSDEPGDVPF